MRRVDRNEGGGGVEWMRKGGYSERGSIDRRGV